MENNTPKKHNITFYIPTRVKITNVPGDTHIAAINFAQSAFRPDMDRVLSHHKKVPLLDGMAIDYAEPDDDLTNYLVDEVGDDEFENTRVYQPDLILDRDIVECEGGRTQFDKMKALLDELAITFQAGTRTDDVDWDDLTPLLEQAVDLMGRDRIADLEAAEAYLEDDFDPFEEYEQAFVVVRLKDPEGHYFHARVPEELRPKMSKAFPCPNEAFNYLQELHAKYSGEIEEIGSDFPLMRVVLCKESEKGVYKQFSYT